MGYVTISVSVTAIETAFETILIANFLIFAGYVNSMWIERSIVLVVPKNITRIGYVAIVTCNAQVSVPAY